MGMRLHQPRQDEVAGHVLDPRAAGVEIRPDRGDPPVADQHVLLGPAHRAAVADQEGVGHGSFLV